MGDETRRGRWFRIRALWGRLAPVGDFLRGREAGNSVVEYALLLALVSLAIVAAMSLLGSSMSNMFNNLTTYLANVVRS